MLFSVTHLFWLFVTVLVVVGCISMRRWPTTSQAHAAFRSGIFGLVLINELAWFAYRHLVADVPIEKNLPLHLCDMSVFVMFVALATRRRIFVELSYYAGVSGALFAVVFPAISESGSIRLIAEIRYFVTHIALVGVGFYLTFGCHYHPPWKAVLRSYAALHVYALAITPINLLLGTNYFFTLSAPKQIAFALPYPHWMFLVAVSALFLVIHGVMHAPFAWRRWLGESDVSADKVVSSF